MLCYQAGYKTEELELEDLREIENSLPDSLAVVAMASRDTPLLLIFKSQTDLWSVFAVT